MQTLKKSALVLAVTAILFVVAAPSQVMADRYGPYHPNTYGHNGYWDRNHRYHNWETYHGRQGYWQRRDDGVRVFINL